MTRKMKSHNKLDISAERMWGEVGKMVLDSLPLHKHRAETHDKERKGTPKTQVGQWVEQTCDTSKIRCSTDITMN